MHARPDRHGTVGRPGARNADPRPWEVISRLAEVRVGENETFESALRRFNKKIQQSGILAEARRREHYEKPSGEAEAQGSEAQEERPHAAELGAHRPDGRSSDPSPVHQPTAATAQQGGPARGATSVSLQDRLQQDLTAAMRSGDALRRDTLCAS